MQELYADVIVDITSKKLDRAFQYRVPRALEEAVEPGTVVEVPFGRGGRSLRGYVIRLTDTAQVDPAKIKEILRAVTDSQGEEERLIRLAAWMRARYGCTMIQALKTVIPVKQKVRPREKTVLELALPPEEAAAKLTFFRKRHQTARARLLEALMEQPSLPGELVREKLGITSAVIRAMADQGVITLHREQVWRSPVISPGKASVSLTPNEQQRRIVDTVIAQWEESAGTGRYLIHGVTGSGKTLVYLELIDYALRRGQQAIVLIPEIALTYQTVMRFYRRFGDRVSLINSRLSPGERYDQFERARRGEISVMVGPRSALFTPFPDLGIIVIDEEHEGAYDSETMPRYHAVETAFQRAKIEKARVVLGSATPSLNAYYAACRGKICLMKLTKRASGAHLPRVEVVDLRRELQEGNRSLLSRSLREKMEETLERGEQIMLFLNRRGYAGAVSCRSCGHVMKCPHCDVSLSLHQGGRLKCHYCGYEMKAVSSCPECGSGFIRAFKAGTQQVEQEVKRLYPDARVLRMDMDTTGDKEGHARILSAFAGGEADILIGTQMIVKGHDFPSVTLVGVLAADLSLSAADYRASERTFQLLTQAVGRAGRADREGWAVIQTYEPEHYAVQCAARQDYEAFYRQEIEYRLLGMYPPAGAMAAVRLSGPDEAYLDRAAAYLGEFARAAARKYGAAVLGPADESVAKIQDQYRRVLYLKAGGERELTLTREMVERYIQMNEGFRPISIQYDVE